MGSINYLFLTISCKNDILVYHKRTGDNVRAIKQLQQSNALSLQPSRNRADHITRFEDYKMLYTDRHDWEEVPLDTLGIVNT